jgi:hypothetical protein
MNAQATLKKWVHRLGLEHWEIEFLVLSPTEYEELEQLRGLTPGESQAHVAPCPDRGDAQMALKIGSDRPELSIIHELLHLNQNGMNEVMEKMANAIDSRILGTSLAESYIDAHEHSVHTTAKAFYNLQNMYEAKIAKLQSIVDAMKIKSSVKGGLEPKEVTKMVIRKRHKKQPIGFHMEEEK